MKIKKKGIICLLVLLLLATLNVGCASKPAARNTSEARSPELPTNDMSGSENDSDSDGVPSTESAVQNENSISENRVSKLDSEKDWVYDADYYLPTDKESYYGYSDHSRLIRAEDLVLPYINIDTADVTQANQEIYELYEVLIDSFNANLEEEIWFTLVEYQTYTNDNLISVVITTESGGTAPEVYHYYTYSFNLDDGSLLSYDEAYQAVGFTEDNIDDAVQQAITNTMNSYRAYIDETEFDNYNNMSIHNYRTSVDNDSICFFINENKKLNVIVTLNMPIGNGEFDTVIVVE